MGTNAVAKLPELAALSRIHRYLLPELPFNFGHFRKSWWEVQEQF